MKLNGKKVGIALTGSVCTFTKVFDELERLVLEGAVVTTIISYNTADSVSRFGCGKDFIQRAKQITGREPIMTIPDAEPIGPKHYFDVLAIFPCTGNTMAKFANGITDTPVLMAAKSHMRNQKPLVISISTNDALGMNLKSLAKLINVRNIYFVPFGQDAPENKAASMVAHTDLLIPTLEHALDGEQIQPMVVSPF